MNPEKPSYFVRSLIVVLTVGLILIVYFAFFIKEPRFEITTGLIAVIGLTVVLVLAEAFDQLSLGKFLSLQRRAAEAESAKVTLSDENERLRNQIVSLVSNIQQQVNTTFNAPPEAWAKLLGVVPAKEPEVDRDELSEPSVPQPAEPQRATEARNLRFERWRAAERIALSRYFRELGVPESERIVNAEFSTAFHGIDPVMERRIVFDGYVRSDNEEKFIEVIRSRVTGFMQADRLYVMLTKVWLYRQVKKTNAELTLLVVEIDEEDESPRRFGSERLIEYFQPAVTNKLLRIERMKITDQDLESENNDPQQSLL